MKIATGFQIVGHSYSPKGRFNPGRTVITLANGMEEQFSESVSLSEAIQICKARGIITQVLEDKLQRWVKTGKWE